MSHEFDGGVLGRFRSNPTCKRCGRSKADHAGASRTTDSEADGASEQSPLDVLMASTPGRAHNPRCDTNMPSAGHWARQGMPIRCNCGDTGPGSFQAVLAAGDNYFQEIDRQIRTTLGMPSDAISTATGNIPSTQNVSDALAHTLNSASEAMARGGSYEPSSGGGGHGGYDNSPNHSPSNHSYDSGSSSSSSYDSGSSSSSDSSSSSSSSDSSSSSY